MVRLSEMKVIWFFDVKIKIKVYFVRFVFIYWVLLIDRTVLSGVVFFYRLGVVVFVGFVTCGGCFYRSLYLLRYFFDWVRLCFDE